MESSIPNTMEAGGILAEGCLVALKSHLKTILHCNEPRPSGWSLSASRSLGEVLCSG